MGVDGTGFYEIAQRCPDRLAIVGEGGPLGYGELGGRVDRVAHVLRGLGARPGDSVATVLGNRPEFLTVLLAALQVGVYMVPVNRHLTRPEITYILADGAARVVITEEGLADVAAGAAADAGIPPANRLTVDGGAGLASLGDLCAAVPDGPPPDRRMGSVMLYTSGTTGRPKGVRRPLLDIPPEVLMDLLGQTIGRHLGLTPGDDVHLAVAPLYHSAPCIHALMSLNLGHTVAVSSGFDAEGLLADIERFGVTNSVMVPTMFHRLLRLPPEARERHDVSSLRRVYHTAAPVPVDTKQRMLDWWGPVLFEYYGSTESGPVVTASAEEWLERPGTVGRAVEGVEIQILDPDGRPLPPGETGLVYARGQAGFSYHGDPDKTAASMRGDFYTPGDVGRLDDDGWLYLADRRTDLIISGGVNLYPAEIEAVLLGHPAVADAAVIGIPDQEWGERPLALVEPADDAAPGPDLADALLAHCSDRLAKIKHPVRIEFRDDLPRTPTGKLSRRKVRERYLAESAD